MAELVRTVAAAAEAGVQTGRMHHVSRDAAVRALLLVLGCLWGLASCHYLLLLGCLAVLACGRSLLLPGGCPVSPVLLRFLCMLPKHAGLAGGIAICLHPSCGPLLLVLQGVASASGAGASGSGGTSGGTSSS